MTLLKSLLCALGVAALGAGAAQEGASHPVQAHAKVRTTDAQAIEQVLKKQFDKPQAPLVVNPVSIEGDFAVAGWTQDARGGRALLHREKGYWGIALCGGDGLVQADALVQSGLTASAAKRLAQAIQTAEAKLPADQRKKLSTFEGTVKVSDDHAGHHGSVPAVKQ